MVIEKNVKLSGKANIELSIFDMYKYIMNELDVDVENHDTYCEVENGELVTYRDISRHGSPSYEPYKRRSVTPAEERLIKGLLELKNDFRKVSHLKEFESLLEQSEYINSKIKVAKENLG